MEPLSITFIGSVFLAGVLMFLAPCTLPLLPAYLGYMSGVTRAEMEGQRPAVRRRHVVKHALFFVVGFSVVFILFGSLVGFAGTVLAPMRAILEVVGGVLILVFGLFMLGVLNLPFLVRERRVKVPAFFTLGTPLSSLALGAAFAVGWTPCIGPIYGTVLFYVSGTETVFAGAFLLFVFSLGFSIPFLLVAAGLGTATKVIDRAGPVLRFVSLLGGAVLVLLGLSLILGDTALTEWFFRLFDSPALEEALLPYL